VGVIAVIGGSGFLGHYVVRALREAGAEPRILSRRTGFDGSRIAPAMLQGCDAVVNLAGIKREEGTQTFRSVHVELVARLVEGMKSAGVRRLVHISVVVARPAPDLPYHDTKWKGEEIVRASGLDWTILRPGVIYGAGDDLLSHLALMLRTAPIFPIVNNGSAPMMPVDAGDVAAAVTGALRSGASVGKTYEIVGPDRLRLCDVVKRVAEAMEARVWICPTPVALMRIPVRLMEAVMKNPLSTRPQLAMLVEGMIGDPGPARAELGVEPAPFTAERLRPLIRAAPMEIRAAPAIGFCAQAAVLLALAFRGPLDPWKGMTVAMGILLAGSLGFKAVRRRLVPSIRSVGIGLLSGGMLYGLTRLVILVLQPLYPAWESHAAALIRWKEGYSSFFILTTFVMIVVAEELVWRGVVARFAMERFGGGVGIVAGAALYAAAHVVTLNPLLVAAALGCGLYWGILYAATDDLTAPVVSHLVWDVMILFVAPVV
jgi:uncharacterized protein YbjT (DUF2867 family)/membrane protease YdiL (CAAX protease family)